MRPTVRSVVAIAILLVVALAAFLVHEKAARAGDLISFFGSETWHTVDHADRVEVFRLRDSEGSDGVVDSRSPLEDHITNGQITPPAAWVRSLRTTLRDPNGYSSHHAKCIPSFGVAVRFRLGAECVDMLICFKCDQVSLASPGNLKIKDLASGRSSLVAMAKQMFPRDEVIQSLTSDRVPPGKPHLNQHTGESI